MQYRGLALVPAGLQAVHVIFGVVSVVIVAAAAVTRLRRRVASGGLYAAITVGLIANAFVSGALSGVYDRYQSRLVWLAPFALMLIAASRWQRADQPEAALARQGVGS